ncbi:MAG: ABC transporter substrate-binding protein [Cryomorphaceae bacterium]|nr:ABC transporter substrate-binding protein [Cryomorphaceae bacterium]
MISLHDQLGREVQIKGKPRRIISLVPSQTHLLYDLGCGDTVVGITKFCVHPADWRKEKTVVGGTKNFHHDRIDQLRPDLIIANKEENRKEDISILAQKYPVYVSDISTVNEALTMIRDIGQLTHTKEAAENMILKIERGFDQLPSKIGKNRSVLYFIWRNPWMVAGNDTYIHDLLTRMGYQNIVEQNRYPNISDDEIKSLNPDCILLSSEPFPFSEKHIAELRAICPNAEIKLVDGELYSWYGSMMLKTLEYLNRCN